MNWIAEIGSNHNQDKQRLHDLIVQSKEAGFTHIKLQKFNGKKLIHGQDKSDIELSDELFMYAVDLCIEYNIKLGCSVFDIESLNFVAPHVDFLKISSFDVERTNLINACINTEKNVLISFGMLDIDKIKSILKKHRSLIPFHCISGYPIKLNECRMEKLFEIGYISWGYDPGNAGYGNQGDIGWSDHTVNEIAILTAMSKGATWIETHVDLDDMKGAESHHGHVWPMSRIGKLIKDYNDCCRYEDEFKGDRMNMADPEDGMRPPKDLR